MTKLWISLGLLLCLAPGTSGGEAPDLKSDEAILRTQRIATDGPTLLRWLQDRSLTAEEQAKLEPLIARLGAKSFGEREKAEKELQRHGEAARRLLELAVKNPDLEIARRAQRCLEAIERTSNVSVTTSVIRVLTARRPPGTVAMLLRYLPQGGDQSAEEEEILTSLKQLVDLKSDQPDPLLAKAITDRDPRRRAAAGTILGRSPNPKQRAAVQPLLRDPDLVVRLRTIQGLLAGRERAAVPVLIDLLRDMPESQLWRVEELLVSLAGEASLKLPAVTSNKDRTRVRDQWNAWWQTNRDKVDLARVAEGQVYLGLTLIPEMHANQVTEVDREGKVRWKLQIPQPRCAQMLPNGHLLVGEVSTNRVTERDRKGEILWETPMKDPSFCQRLPGGNTLMGSGHRIVEVTSAGKEVWSYQTDGNFYIHGMDRKKNGNLVLLSMNGELREITPPSTTVFSINLDSHKGGRNWCGVQGLPNGRYLVVDISQGEVLEIDQKGTKYWEYKFADACFAQRLPNGNTLVGSFNQKVLVEVDRSGKTVWQYKTETNPWRFSRR